WQPSPLPELPIQYADFAVWQRRWLKEEVFQDQLIYWQQQLAGSPTLMKLPTDYPRPSTLTSRGAGFSFTLSSSLTKSLKSLSHEQGTTLFMSLLAAIQLLLYRYSGQDDIVIGVPIT